MARGFLKDKEYRLTDISEYIRKRMRLTHTTQKDLATALGKSQSRISIQLKNGDFTIEELLIIFKMVEADADKVGRLFIL